MDFIVIAVIMGLAAENINVEKNCGLAKSGLGAETIAL